MLSGIGITKYFGGLVALKDVSFDVKKGEIVGLIGPNGAGKTTLFNVISGIYRPTQGKVVFEGKEITKLKPHQICRLGIARTFQLVRPFLNMAVLENVVVGSLFGKRRSISMEEARKEALYYIDFVGKKGMEDIPVKNLTLADRKIVELARALATHPKIILIDEIVAGLNPTETVEAMKLIERIRDVLGIAVFWIEHVMKAVMNVAERIIVLHYGEKIAEGTPEEIARDEKTISAYLGEKYIF